MPTGSDLQLATAYLAVLFGPGVLLALSVGLRGWTAASAGPLITLGIVGAISPVLPQSTALPIIAYVAAASMLLSALSWLGRRIRRRHRADKIFEGTVREPAEWSVQHHLGVAAAVLLSATIGARIVYEASTAFSAIPQWWDAMFHANAMRFIADTGATHPAALRVINQAGNDEFYYPNGYHVLNAAVLQVSGADVPHVINIGNALIAGIFALAVAALVRVFGGRPALCVAAAFLACAFQSFPYDVIVWGPLFPYVLGVALLPAWLAAVRATLDGASSAFGRALGLATASVGLLAVHPATAITAVVLGLALLAQRWLSTRHVSRPELVALALGGAGAALLGLPLIAGVLGVPSGPVVDWGVTHSPSAAVGDLLTQSRGRQFPPWWLIFPAIIGLLNLRTLKPLHWYMAASGVFGVLFVMAASYEGHLVALLTGPWWNDGWRMAALFTPLMLLLAAGGYVWVCDQALALVRRFVPPTRSLMDRHRMLFSAPALLLVLAFVYANSQGLYHNDNLSRVAHLYPDGPGVSTAERAALAVLGDVVPEGAVVMNDPQDGSAWMWALEGVRPVFGAPVVLGREAPQLGPEKLLLLRHFNQIDRDPEVAAAVHDLGIEYVFLGEGYIDNARTRVEGLQHLDRIASLELIFDNSDGKIYRVLDESMAGPAQAGAPPSAQGPPR